MPQISFSTFLLLEAGLQTASWSSVKSTETVPAYFLADKSSMSWQEQVTWSTIGIPHSNPAYSIKSSGSMIDSMRDKAKFLNIFGKCRAGR